MNAINSVTNCSAFRWLCLCLGRQRRADLEVEIQETGYTATTLTTSSGGSIPLSGTYAGAPDFSFPGGTGFTASSTLGSTQGILQGNGEVDSLSSGSQTLTIMITDTGYTQPVGPGYLMDSNSAYTFSGTSSSDSFSFQSFATAGQVAFGTAVPSPGHTYSPLMIFGSDNFDEGNTSFSAGSGYTLTQSYTWVSTGAGDDLLLSGHTTAISTSVVPEPSSLVMFGLGSLGLGVVVMRRQCA